MSRESDDNDDEEIDRLKAMAARLRAEASSLEADRAQELADAAERVFSKFDADGDGEVSVDELKDGLEKKLKIELSDRRVKELMEELDSNSDGVLQKAEFVTIDQFRSRLDRLARREKERARDAKTTAEEESRIAKSAEAKSEMLNDRPPTGRDRWVSVLPYLFPLMDGLAYGRFLLQNVDGTNPIADVVASLYVLYRSIPFSGFVAFFALNFLQGKTRINRQIRFNAQQAIYLDIALFFPGLVTGLLGLVTGWAGATVDPTVVELSTDAIFVTLIVVLGYCTVSSLLGVTPDKIPYVSKSVENRMPTLDMFDDEGNMIPPRMPTEEEIEEYKKKNGDKDDDEKK